MGARTSLDFTDLGAKFVKLVKGAKRVVVGSHLNPDGDAIGSSLAMSGALKALGVPHDVLFHHEAPANLTFLKGPVEVKHVWDGQHYDVSLVLDLEALDRLGSVGEAFTSAGTMVVIDHHVPTAAPGDLRIVSAEYPATCSILLDLFNACEIPISPDMAECLATGILTDTGNFRYPNTTAASLHQVAQLVELGADVSRVSELVYMKRTLASSRLNGYVMSEFKLAMDDRVAYVTVPFSEFERTQGNEDDTEGFVSELLGIQGVEAAFLLRESKPGVIRGSLRSRGDIDVAAAAREFGGGGHKNAAGVSLSGGVHEAEQKILGAVGRALGA